MKKRYPYRTSIVVNGHRYDIKAKTRQEMMDKVDLKRAQELDVHGDIYTVSEWVDICIDDFKPNITNRARAGYVSKCKHFTKFLGDYQLWRVTPIMCQFAINQMAGYSEYTVRKVRELMYFVFSKAVTYQLLDKNPAADISLPTCVKSQRRRELTPEERQKVIETIPKKPQYLMYGFCLFCGCRPAEASNVRRDDIDGKLLHVRGTKTENADRWVYLPSAMRDIIPEDATGYLVTDANGHPMTANTRRRTWVKFRQDAGLPDDVVCYNLRHTYASQMLYDAHIDISRVSKMMGHSSVKLTSDVYGHIDKDNVLDAGNDIEKYYDSEIVQEQDSETIRK